MEQATPRCAHCGEPFALARSAPWKRFCSAKCRDRAKKRAERTCPTCHVVFAGTGLRQVYCSRACVPVRRKDATWPAIADRRHPACRLWVRSCTTCGQVFTSRTSRKRCSSRCDAVAHAAKLVVTVSCPECGSLFTPVYGDKRRQWCSVACSKVAHRRLRKGRLADRPHESIGLAQVAARDGWRCQLCRRTVDPTLVVPHPKAATIDHIVPRNDGGTHEMSNVQLAHFDCNWRKGDGDAQLRWTA